MSSYLPVATNNWRLYDANTCRLIATFDNQAQAEQAYYEREASSVLFRPTDHLAMLGWFRR